MTAKPAITCALDSKELEDKLRSRIRKQGDMGRIVSKALREYFERHQVEG